MKSTRLKADLERRIIRFLAEPGNRGTKKPTCFSSGRALKNRARMGSTTS
jgi:hypothetical protein